MIDPNDIQAYQARGRAKSKLEDYQGAIEDYLKVKNIEPSFINYVYAPLLQNYLVLNQKQEAIELIDELIESMFPRSYSQEDRNTKSFFSTWMKSIIHYGFSDYSAAITYLDKAIDLQPQYTHLYLYRGLAYQQLGKEETAKQNYQKILSIDPEKSIFKEVQQIQEQIQKQEIPPKIFPQFNYDSYLSEAYYVRGSAYYYLDNFSAAQKDIEKAIILNTNNALAYQTRSFILEELGDSQGAEEDLTKYLELLESNGNPLFSIFSNNN
jgi:tetratricopeptide (TPR) repeat protein